MSCITVTNAGGEVLPCPEGRITPEILQKSQGILKIGTRIPIVDTACIWHADAFAVPPMKLPWRLDFHCGFSRSLPLLVFLNRNYRVKCAVGLTNGIDDCHVSCKMDQENCRYEVSFAVSVAPETGPFEVFRDVSGRPLIEVLHEYRAKIMPARPSYPQGAWEPVYCTWYAAHAALTDEYMRRNAEEAARLGFGTFIVDDGWCYDESKRVTPQTLPEWYRDVGDWRISGKKLPGLRDTVSQAQKLGLNYIFWVAPFLVGSRCALDSDISRFLTELHEGYRICDPADATASRKTAESIFSVFETMALDGLKIDFIDQIEPDINRPHGRAVKRYLERLIGKIREAKPDALIEFRQRYATPVTAALATAFRAGDVPFDFVENYSRCVQLRLILGDGMPVHADPVYFGSGESAETVGCHMIASLIGVPMLSIDLRTVSDEHKKVIANYLRFYRDHQKTLNAGHWDFTLKNGFASAASCSGNDETVVFLTDAVPPEKFLQNPQGKLVVLNMSPDPVPFPGKLYDAQGNLCPCGHIPPGGRAER